MNILSAPLATDPRFNASTGWSNVGEGNAWDINGDGAAVQRGTEDGGITLRPLAATLEGERQFRVDLHIDGGTYGRVRPAVGNATTTVRTEPGAYSEIVSATDLGAIGLWTNFAGDLRITFLEVYEIIEVA